MTKQRGALLKALVVSFIVLALPTFICPTSFAAEPIVIDHNCIDSSQIPQQFLDAAREMDVFFNHKSVGYNILDGLSDLAGQDPTRYACTIELNPSTAWYDDNSGFGHFALGTNYQPYTKVDGFNDHITTNGYGGHVDVAMMKFCYVDFYEEHGWGSDYTGEQVWNYYRPVMESLEAAYPDVTFVWWTCALNQWWGIMSMKSLIHAYASTAMPTARSCSISQQWSAMIRMGTWSWMATDILRYTPVIQRTAAP